MTITKAELIELVAALARLSSTHAESGQLRVRWVLAIVIGLAVAVGVALLVPT